MARKLAYDRLLLADVLGLTIFGLVMVYSSTTALVQRNGLDGHPYFLKQCLAAVLGFVILVCAMHGDYRWLRKPFVLYTGVAVVLTLLVLVLFGPELNNSRRWFKIGGLSVQPSELAKLVLVTYLAYQIDKKRGRLDSAMFLVPTLGLTGIICGLIFLGKDLGTTLLISIPAGLMLYLAGLAHRRIVAAGVTAAVVAALAVWLTPFRMARVTSFLHPESDPQGQGFQLLQSLIAVGSGGLFGLGPGNSVQKLHFLPSPHADFVFSIVAEEVGFLGSLLILGLFAVFVWRGVEAGLGAPDAFGRHLAWGFTALIGVQAMVHVSVALGLMPTTGVPLPFISHGGSSLVVSLAAAGVILNVSEHG